MLGQDPKLVALQRASKEIFDLTANYWRQTKASGQALYQFMDTEVNRRGYRRHMDGHRLSDFPHHAYHRGDLKNFEQPASPCAWVLEVCIIDEQLQRAAFYEDLSF